MSDKEYQGEELLMNEFIFSWCFHHPIIGKDVQEEFNKFKQSKTKEHKDYEILDYANKFSEKVAFSDIIWRVKRLSDGEVFSVGDEVENALGKYKIQGFNLFGSIMYLNNWIPNQSMPLSHISKVKQPIPLTENNLSEYSLMEMGFNIAREVHSNNPIGRIEYYDGDCGEHYPYKYKTFFQYVKSKIV